MALPIATFRTVAGSGGRYSRKDHRSEGRTIVGSLDVRPIPRSAVTKEAIKRIQDLIRSGRVRPGDRLPPERELAASLGISRNSLREAVRALGLMNILYSRQGDGTYVTSLEPELLVEPIHFVLNLNPDSVFHLFEVRRVLEAGAAQVVADRVDDADLEELRGCLAKLKSHTNDLRAFLEADVVFHGAIFRAARNPLLTSLMAAVGSLALDSRLETVRLPQVRRQTVLDHAVIYGALKRRDRDGSRDAMIAHLANVEKSLRKARQESPERSRTRRPGPISEKG